MPESKDRQQQKKSKTVSKTQKGPVLGDENIEALADRLVDALVVSDPPTSPETASAKAPPVETASIELDGDHGEDIDDRLQSLFGDERPTAAAALPVALDSPAIDEPASKAVEAEVEVEVATPTDLFRPEAPATPMANVQAASPAPPTEKRAVPAAGQIAARAQQPTIPWSQTKVEARPESSPRRGSKNKWLAVALLVGGLTSLAWLVLIPSSGRIEETTVASAVPTPRRTSPPATPPVTALAAVVEPGRDLTGAASANPDTTAPIESTGTPESTAGFAAEAPTKPAPTPKPPVSTVASKPVPTRRPPVSTTASKPVPTRRPPVSTVASKPVPTRRPPVTTVPAVAPTWPELISRQAPIHRKRDGRGVVVLNVLVTETGRVSRVVIKEGLPGSPLEASAINAALGSTYRPATEDGQPVRAWAVERFEFK